MDLLDKMLPYLFRYDGAVLVFTGPGEFDIYVRETLMEKVKLNLDT